MIDENKTQLQKKEKEKEEEEKKKKKKRKRKMLVTKEEKTTAHKPILHQTGKEKEWKSLEARPSL